MAVRLTLTGAGQENERRVVEVPQLIVAGWTGRDAGAVEKHIRELEALGVPRPSAVPLFYRVSAALLTTSDEIQVVGPDTSGEVEPVLLVVDGETWIGVGSDHTDRRAERMGVSLAKQLCAKPIGREFWRFREVADHWDEVVLRAWAVREGECRLYQEGTAAALLRPEALLDRYQTLGRVEPGAVMFCGTLPVIGSIESMDRFEICLDDPVLDRSIRCQYGVDFLPRAD